MIDCLPRWDVLVTQYFPIDTDYWQGTGGYDRDGKNGVVKIGHSPNHRPLKGTNFLIRAVQELRDEGLKIELVLLENHQNSEVRDILRDVDIIVADVMLQGYAVMAVEGLSLGKPVVQDISDEHYNRVFKLYTGLDEAPFVSTPIEKLRENLRKLVTQPRLRQEIGEKSRAYALKYHSYEANARFWIWLYEWLWYGRRERLAFYHPDWPVSTLGSLNQVRPTADQLAIRQQVLGPLNDLRKQAPSGRVAFYPVNDRTYPVLEALYLTGTLRSYDYLVVEGEASRPRPTRCWPQAAIRLEELAAHGVGALYVLDRDRTEPLFHLPAGVIVSPRSSSGSSGTRA
jgi:hypothetical protein